MGKKVIHEGPHPGARASRPHSTWHKEMSVDVSPSTAKSLRARPTRERGRLARIRPGTRKCPWTSAHIQQKLASGTHPGARASRPHSTWHKEMSVDVSPYTAKSLRARPHPGARASRPHSTWHKEMSVDVSPYTAKSLRAGPTRERGRLARIRPGNRATNLAKVGSAHPARNRPLITGCSQE